MITKQPARQTQAWLRYVNPFETKFWCKIKMLQYFIFVAFFGLISQLKAGQQKTKSPSLYSYT